MKFAIVFVALFAVALAQDAQIISYKNDNDGLGSYSFNYETSDGESRQEEGHHENIGVEYDALKVQGSYQYYGDDDLPKMKFVIVFAALFALAVAVPVPQNAEILKFENDVQVDGFNYAFETSDGISQSATGQFKQIGEEGAIVQSGSFAFTADDGQRYEVNWIADENGFQPEVLICQLPQKLKLFIIEIFCC
uniref:Uncharacterized protein n=1 Tax=Megaselia scalaris TaxID=36166 RepID=T1GQJ2_MEGSC